VEDLDVTRTTPLKKSDAPTVRMLHAQQIDAKAKMLWQKLGAIEYRAISDLTAYARKLRKHPERQIIQLMASMRTYGCIKPVLIDMFGVIICGEACVEAARRLGLTDIPTLRLEHLTPAQVKAYRIADNKLASLSSFDEQVLIVELEEIIALGEVPIESIGFITAEIDTLSIATSLEPEADPLDELPELPAVSISRTGDLWRLGNHRLLCGSSLDAAAWVRLMDGKIAVMSFTDPPYNTEILGQVSGLGKVKHAEFAMASGEMSPEEFVQFCGDWLRAISAHLAAGAILHVSTN
jgi:ParB-like chromosome segregation protein Spo0J